MIKNNIFKMIKETYDAPNKGRFLTKDENLPSKRIHNTFIIHLNNKLGEIMMSGKNQTTNHSPILPISYCNSLLIYENHHVNDQDYHGTTPHIKRLTRRQIQPKLRQIHLPEGDLKLTIWILRARNLPEL